MAAPHKAEKYEKIISQYDLNTLCISSSIRGHVWEEDAGHGMEKLIGVVDTLGNRYNWRGRMRIDKGHRKPEVNGEDWQRFVHAKQLRVSDKIVFYRMPPGEDPQLIFRVTVSRLLAKPIRLFGTDIFYGPEE